jgi:hypothetical protein
MTLHVVISPELASELKSACADCCTDRGSYISPSQFATQCVESVLAQRRLDRMDAAKTAAYQPEYDQTEVM